MALRERELGKESFGRAVLQREKEGEGTAGTAHTFNPRGGGKNRDGRLFFLSVHLSAIDVKGGAPVL